MNNRIERIEDIPEELWVVLRLLVCIAHAPSHTHNRDFLKSLLWVSKRMTADMIGAACQMIREERKAAAQRITTNPV